MDSPVCSQCQATSSLMWHKKKDGSILCLECHSNETTAFDSQTPSTSKTDTESTENPSGQNSTEPCEGPPQNGASVPTGNNNSHGRRTRLRERGGKGKQSSRGPEKPKIGGGGGGSASQGTGGANNGGSKSQQQQPKATSSGSRRKQSKQARPQKAPKPQTTVVTSDSVLHKGTMYEVGDIVSILDRDGGVYYAIIRGFLQDQYAEKYAILMWLLPVHPDPTHFDPSQFVLGPEEDIPRSMEFLEFVCHSPQSRHFQASYFHSIEQAETWKGPTLPHTQTQELS